MAKPTRATRGPKPKFLDVACPNSRCQHRGKTDLGNVVSNGTYRTRRTGRARLFLCRACGKAFSSRTGTAFFGLRTRKRTVLLGLRLLAEGLGLRGTARVLEVKLDTVRGWLALAAQHCDHVSHLLLRELRLSQVQVDELWTFVKKTPRSPWADNPQAPLAPNAGARAEPGHHVDLAGNLAQTGDRGRSSGDSGPEQDGAG